jgi:hypothetical protein
MQQQGQVFKLKTKDSNGRVLWAYRYRVGGRGSKRIQRGGFQTELEAYEDPGADAGIVAPRQGTRK